MMPIPDLVTWKTVLAILKKEIAKKRVPFFQIAMSPITIQLTKCKLQGLFCVLFCNYLISFVFLRYTDVRVNSDCRMELERELRDMGE